MIIAYCIALLLVGGPALGDELEEDVVCVSQNGLKGFCLLAGDCPTYENVTGVVTHWECEQGEVCCTPPPDPDRISLPDLDLDSTSCGLSNMKQTQRVVGGSPAEVGAYPWIAALGYKVTKKDKRLPPVLFICSGSLINKRYVVTAAHCVRVPKTVPVILKFVRLGEHDLANQTDGANPVDYGIQHTIVHRHYSYWEKFNDIALIRLNRDVTFTDQIHPICLPSPALLKMNLERTAPFVAGWGATKYRGPLSNTLLHVQVPVVNNELCRRSYSREGYVITKAQICAGNMKLGRNDTCTGDSGGPLMMPIVPRYYLIGVVAFGHKCAEPGFPGVYTRVSSYINWIRANAPDE